MNLEDLRDYPVPYEGELSDEGATRLWEAVINRARLDVDKMPCKIATAKKTLAREYEKCTQHKQIMYLYEFRDNQEKLFKISVALEPYLVEQKEVKREIAELERWIKARRITDKQRNILIERYHLALADLGQLKQSKDFSALIDEQKKLKARQRELKGKMRQLTPEERAQSANYSRVKTLIGIYEKERATAERFLRETLELLQE